MIRTKPTTCTICNHPKRLEIDRSIATGKSYEGIARGYGVDPQAVSRHAHNHLSHQLATAIDKQRTTESLDLLDEIEDLLAKSKDILDKAEKDEKYALALSAIRECRGVLELLVKISYALHEVRMLELQMMKEKDGTAQKEREEQLTEKLSILTDTEFDMYEKLCLKIENQSHKIIIPDPPKFESPKTNEKALPQAEESEELEEEELVQEEPLPKLEEQQEEDRDPSNHVQIPGERRGLRLKRWEIGKKIYDQSKEIIR